MLRKKVSSVKVLLLSKIIIKIDLFSLSSYYINTLDRKVRIIYETDLRRILQKKLINSIFIKFFGFNVLVEHRQRGYLA